MSRAADKPDVRRKTAGVEAIAIKSASVDGLALVLRTTDMTLLADELRSRFHDTALSITPLLLDVSAIEAQEQNLRLAELMDLARTYMLQPVGIVGARGALLDSARRLGLSDMPDIGSNYRRATATASDRSRRGSAADAPGTELQAQAQMEQAQRQIVDQAVREALASRSAPTMIVTRPLRSGQRVYAQGGDLVVCSMVSHGAEVLADGHIHVYGPLRGRAIAGASGNIHARIFTSCMEPDLYAIAGIYHTTDIPLATEIHGKPAQVRLEGERLIVEPLRG
jgi:septum site-determining protein MinC